MAYCVCKACKAMTKNYDLFFQRLVHATYKLAKFLVPVLSDITQNEFTVKDSFTFVDEILTQSSDLYMASLDVDALFTIPSDETIDICVKKLLKLRILCLKEYLKMIFMIY